ncbi:unnamed protein product [Candidula unifasciata]|uniref:LITAF domain-containing protein n=1 Tax=Candidula unifasciata TaxID=100452 RepID=A0A8S3YDC1_9EUPU|nr:unnamed protein product [Candidula unifasciata]
MSKEIPVENPPPYSGHPTTGPHFLPQNVVHPTQPTTAGQPSGYAYPVQPGYGQGYGVQSASYNNTTTIVTQPTIAVIQVYRESPVRTMCPHCQADVVTATHYETGTFTWLACVIICFFGFKNFVAFCIGCCLFPFCINGCKDVVHTCPNCRQQIARYNRM